MRSHLFRYGTWFKKLISLVEITAHALMYFRAVSTSDARCILVEPNYSYNRNYVLEISSQLQCLERTLAGVTEGEMASVSSKCKCTRGAEGGKRPKRTGVLTPLRTERLSALWGHGQQHSPLPVQKRLKWKSGEKEDTGKGSHPQLLFLDTLYFSHLFPQVLSLVGCVWSRVGGAYSQTHAQHTQIWGLPGKITGHSIKSEFQINSKCAFSVIMSQIYCIAQTYVKKLLIDLKLCILFFIC